LEAPSAMLHDQDPEIVDLMALALDDGFLKAQSHE
jgi:hypothetical protein